MRTTREKFMQQCRTCLSHLVNEGHPLKIHPDLMKFLDFLILFNNCTPANANEYPQTLCDLCFKRLKDFFEFRNLVLESTQRIQIILQSKEEDQSDDDNKLLLPELAQCPIKSEPAEAEELCDLETEINFEPEQNNSCDIDGSNDYDVEQQQSSKINIEDSRKQDRSKKSFKCPRCNKHAYKKVNLDAHIRKIHEGLEKPFLCSVLECQKAFTRYNQLHVHFQTNHTININFECDINGCKQSFRSGQNLETHKRVFHKSKNSSPMKQVIAALQKHISSSFENDHFCQECGKKYSSKRALLEHLRRHANDKRHVCQICGVAKVTKTELQTHMRRHNRNLEKFKCSLCPQEFNHKNAISRHIRVVHEGERRFSCSFCPKRFGTKNSQICHQRLHTGEKPFQCEICSKGFAQSEGLKSHMKNHDKTLRKHICKYCQCRFITKKNLIDHEQRHLSHKPFICVTCSRGFSKREELELHQKREHDNLIKTEFELEESLRGKNGCV